MAIIEVSDPADPRLRDYVALRDAQLRQAVEAEYGLFIAEGDKVVRRAAEAGYRVRSFLLAPRWLDGLRDVIDRAGTAPCYVAADEVVEQATGFHVHRGALAAMERRPLPAVDDVLEARGASSCSRISSTTPTSARYSGRRRRSGSTRYC